ncbi:MAG: alpha/beta fold hydrolase [Gemmatimonadetes bacterium]|nr:alpha/beta fold hydrolase [Gemmatimonadota bacterium]
MSNADWGGTLVTLGLVLAIWWPIRLAISLQAEKRFEAAYPRNSKGIIIGAESVHARGVRRGAVLLLHGFNDTPQAMGSLANALHDFGWTVHAPVLPGHARTLQAFARSGANEWMEAVRTEYQVLRARHDAVAVAGMSMGGALALLLAAEFPDVRAVVGIAPYLNATLPMRVMLALSPIAALGAKYIAGGGGRSVRDSQAAQRMIAYRMATPRLVGQLGIVTRKAYAALPQVLQPVLVVQSREDNRIPVRLATRAFERISSPDKTLDWVNGAGHVLTVDYGHKRLESRVVEWLSTRL